MNNIRKLIIVCGLILVPGVVSAQNDRQSDHGNTTKLGTISVSGQKLSVTKLGSVEAGKESAFQVDAAEKGGKKLSELNVYLWIEDQGGAQISAPGKGIVEGDSLHFHVTPKAGATPQRIVVRVRDSGKDEKVSLPLDGHGHEHAATPHEGVVAALKDEQKTLIGYVELKLHDDKGDLELWLARNDRITEPLDLPLDSSVQVTFVDLNNRVVELKPRNSSTNEDEGGVANVRSGKTNYFIYPLPGKDDSSWLKGPEFQSIVQVSFSSGGKKIISDEFMLVPHTHTDGSHH